MPEHIFLQTQQIEPADIHEVLDLTATGQLSWSASDRFPALATSVAYSMGIDTATRRNLLEVRVSFTPSEALNYLRMKNASGDLYCVGDGGSDEELIALANRVLEIGKIALTVPGGRLSGTIDERGHFINV